MLLRTALVAFLTATCLLTAGAHAAPADTKRGELSDLRNRIRSLQDEIARGEESHGEVADELAGSEKAISSAQRRLREISDRRSALEARVDKLQQEKTAVDAEMARFRKSLGDAVFRMYVEGGQGGARRFLSGDNPNQLARDAYYLEQIARQRLKSIEQARLAMLRLDALAIETEKQKQDLLELESERRREQVSLQAERGKQKAVLKHITAQLRDQRQQMHTLQRDEGRMEKLIRGLERIAQEQAEARAKVEMRARAEAEASARALAPSQGQNSSRRKPLVDDNGREEGIVGQATRLPEPVKNGISFASRKGSLGWPVKGSIKGRFGSPRAEGATDWHGVFIRAGTGTEVQSIAAGKVVFADWLRGFGNVVIVDHGDGYMSVYGNNDAVLRNPGDIVHAGETLATVGSSGGQDESGLYFEIRHRGQPQDPAKWMAAK